MSEPPGARRFNLFSPAGTIDRLPYLVCGLLFFALKYLLDYVISNGVFSRSWTPMSYLFPQTFLAPPPEAATAPAFYVSMLAASAPFAWIGCVLTLRRLRSAGLPLWMVALFLFPILNLLLIATLVLVPPLRRAVDPGEAIPLECVRPRPSIASRFALAVPVAGVFGIAGVYVGVVWFQTYGWAVFVGLPFLIGLLVVALLGRELAQNWAVCASAALAAMAVSAMGMLLLAMEGAICLLMAAPPAVAIGLLGATTAHVILRVPVTRNRGFPIACVAPVIMLVLPGLEAWHGAQPERRTVTTEIIIDAPPHVVWQNVIDFPELPPATEWLFRFGVACPVRAEIDGRGVGAVRRCIFTTGTFVEPIDVWEPGRRLRFAVTENPPPLRELSPFGDIRPPHLHGFLESRAGEFELTLLPDGRTRLVGRTWYENHMWPADYWRLWSDAIIHEIHGRVLRHIATLSESSRPLAAAGAPLETR
ncbi:MAG: SRPBCC family protein [Phycisphaerae bacterium]|nr:SRPBCC family protein [Phycisphaerae bacterium]MCZ2400720.1 SRPBCC family protein [Phycisphaerae bacterium]NUQ48645.1 SRPBCC family protein [Phycisphaerae bacterium]